MHLIGIYINILIFLNKTSFLNRFTEKYHLDEKIHFPHDYKMMISDFEASVGLVQLNKYDEIISHRIKMANWYNDNLLRKKDWIFPPIIAGATYSHYVIRVPNRKEIIKEYEKKGLHLVELIQYSIPELGCYKNLGFDCPNSLIASKQTINFPVTSRNEKIFEILKI